MKQAYIFLADGFEEIEAVTPADYLRRAGVNVQLVALRPGNVTAAHGVTVVPDAVLTPDLPLPDLAVLPGGMPGARNLAECRILQELVCRTAAAGGIVAAICAAPAVALYPWGLLADRKFTCYPGMQPDNTADVQYTGARVTVDKTLVTAAGPGTAEEFSLVLVSLLTGDAAAGQVRQGALAR